MKLYNDNMTSVANSEQKAIKKAEKLMDSNAMTSEDPFVERFIEVLMKDDVDSFELFVQGFSEEERIILLNKPTVFNLSNKPSFTLNVKLESAIEMACGKFCLRHPWTYAVAFGAKKILRAMVKHGVNTHVRELNGANCLHILVFLAFLEPETEEIRVSIYKHLLEILTVYDMKLLLEDDSKELRPLEFAAHLQTFQLYSALFETPGVYLIHIEHDGIYSREYFDITTYEGWTDGNRRDKSPLKMFLLLDKRNMGAQHVKQFYESDLMQSWLSSKYNMNYVFMWLWLFVRILLMLIFVLSDEKWSASSHSWNGTSISPCPVTLPWYTKPYQKLVASCHLVTSTAIVLFDVAEIILALYYKKYRYSITPRGRKQLALHYIFYRIVQFGMSLSLFLLCLNFLSCNDNHECVLPVTFSYYLYIFVCVSASWTLLFFLQFAPWFGFVVIALQRMIQDLIAFWLIFVAVMAPHAFAFKKLLSTSDSKCSMDFFKIPQAFYSCFKVMLNMVDFDSYTEKNRSEVMVLHILYVFIVPILMINFLIALFSTSYAEVCANRNTYIFIQKLSVVTTIENRLIRLIPGYYNWQRRRCFLTTDGKVLLRKVVLRDKCALFHHNKQNINGMI